MACSRICRPSVFVAGAGNGGNFAALDPGSGARRWIGGTNGNVQAIAAVAGVVYVGGHYGTYCGPVAGAHTCQHPTSRPKLLAVDESSGTLLPWNPGANSSLGVAPIQPGMTAPCVLALRDSQPPGTSRTYRSII